MTTILVHSLISDCTMETNVTYKGYGIGGSYKEGISTVEACRTYCQCNYDAPFFSWIIRGYCDCYSSDAEREVKFDHETLIYISGAARGCGGACEWLNSELHPSPLIIYKVNLGLVPICFWRLFLFCPITHL